MHLSHLSSDVKEVGEYACHLPPAQHVRKLLGPEWPLATDLLMILAIPAAQSAHTYGTTIYVLSCLPGNQKGDLPLDISFWRSPFGDPPLEISLWRYPFGDIPLEISKRP